MHSRRPSSYAWPSTSNCGKVPQKGPEIFRLVLGAIHETFLRSGVNPEMGLDLFRNFQHDGLPVPMMLS